MSKFRQGDVVNVKCVVDYTDGGDITLFKPFGSPHSSGFLASDNDVTLINHGFKVGDFVMSPVNTGSEGFWIRAIDGDFAWCIDADGGFGTFGLEELDYAPEAPLAQAAE